MIELLNSTKYSTTTIIRQIFDFVKISQGIVKEMENVHRILSCQLLEMTSTPLMTFMRVSKHGETLLGYANNCGKNPPSLLPQP